MKILFYLLTAFLPIIILFSFFAGITNTWEAVSLTVLNGFWQGMQYGYYLRNKQLSYN